ALDAIARHRVTHAQFVPTMFVRMLHLPQEQRDAADVSSLRVAVHAAAPCPVDVKQAMIDWWGPILVEYYAGTEGNGLTMTDSATWLTKPGTVGRPLLGVLHICDDDGRELPTGEIGSVYVERETVPFEYHNDPEKTKASQHPEHETWTTLGDIGYVDGDGFLFPSPPAVPGWRSGARARTRSAAGRAPGRPCRPARSAARSPRRSAPRSAASPGPVRDR
ncbi:AMP-binding protein, partial [Pseudonocardia sp. ICBG601]|uniref:AMP-binding protein n=1 Tax=Pseudonocardia sp. ICBG601 TaxID=2846759 RepID=UPI001CF65B7B